MMKAKRGGEKTSSPQLSTQPKDWQWWRMKIVLPQEFRGPQRARAAFRQQIANIKELRAEFTQPYDVQASWEKARSRHDPLFAPHGMFRALKPGDNSHAIEFLETFGALALKSSPADYIEIGVPVRIDLHEFWNRQSQFRQFAELYESRDDAAKLSKAVRTVVEHRPIHDVFRHLCEQFIKTANASAAAHEHLKHVYGDTLNKMKVKDMLRLIMADEEEGRVNMSLPDRVPVKTRWQLPDRGELPVFITNILGMSFEGQRSEAMAVLGSEINRHVANRTVSWRRDGDKWRLHVSCATSLWDMIWNLFAADTSGTVWRVCPHCQALFYPVRVDRFYCTTRQQILASKRAYARRVRNAAKQKKR
jgi:hypothetical protein